MGLGATPPTANEPTTNTSPATGAQDRPPDKSRRSATSFRKMGRKTERSFLIEEVGEGNAAAGGREDVRQEALVHVHVPQRQIASASRH